MRQALERIRERPRLGIQKYREPKPVQPPVPKYPPSAELIHEDGEPVETILHKLIADICIESTNELMIKRGIEDFVCGGNHFIYYDPLQAQFIKNNPPYKYDKYKGPDYFYVKEADPHKKRESWVAWEENWKYPNVILEVLSKTTEKVDKGPKKNTYQDIFRTPDYFLYDPKTEKLEGYSLCNGIYEPIAKDAEDRLYCRELDIWLGKWKGKRYGDEGVYLRFFTSDGALIPTTEERAETEKERAEIAEYRAEKEKERAETEKERAETAEYRAEKEKERAERAEQELAKLRALL
jgi:Uma2 family endonuclease